VDPLNQTPSFQEGAELKLRDWSQVRRGWSQRTPKTLLDALANMDVNSASSTAAEAEQGAVHLLDIRVKRPDQVFKSYMVTFRYPLLVRDKKQINNNYISLFTKGFTYL